jgi:hypothetical protein
MVRSTDVFTEGDADEQVKAAKAWLADRGVRNFDAVPLSTETFEKVCIKSDFQ